MKKEITVGQLLSVAVSLLIAMATGWITINNKVTKSEEKNVQQDARLYDLSLENEKKFDKLDNKIDEINHNTTNILIKLENKEDRR